MLSVCHGRVKSYISHSTDMDKNKKPFTRPTTPPLLKPADRLTTDPATTKQQAASSSQPNRPQKSDQPKHPISTDTNPPILKKQSASTSVDPTRRDSFSSSDSDSESYSSDRPAVDILGELSDYQDVTLTNPDQSHSED